MSTDLQIKLGDTRGWRFTLQDADESDLNLAGCEVAFALKEREGRTTSYFERDTDDDGSDLIKVSDAAAGLVVVFPTSSDWDEITNYGIYVGEFKVTTAAGIRQQTQDVEVDIQEAIVS